MYDIRLKVSVDHLRGGMTEARLVVSSASLLDSGNYTCSPANSRPAHVSVFVNKGMYCPQADYFSTRVWGEIAHEACEIFLVTVF